MTSRTQRRYQLRNAELNDLIEELVERAQKVYSDTGSGEYARQLVVTALLMLRDGADDGDRKLITNAIKEMRHANRVFAEYEHIRKVAVFGSARTEPTHPEWLAARDFAERIVRAGWMVITGAGDGIMGAAQGGAGRERSFGVNIRLPFEQRANAVIDGDPKLINFRYFFTRKVTFVKESHAVVLFPGGFGTHDEGFETLTLIQTGKSEIVPVVYIDEPGGSYWKDWETYVNSHLHQRGLISEHDLALFKVTDSVDEALAEVVGFYRNYHSCRYVRDRLVLRCCQAPDASQLEELNRDFADIVDGGRIEVSEALPGENGEAQGLPRVSLRFNRRDIGRLRQFIDRLNALVPEGMPSPCDASPHQIVPVNLPPGAEKAEDDDAEE